MATTFKKSLEELGIIFSPFSEAVKEHPDLIKKYLGSVVPYTDNFFATLNSAVFSDGSFVYIPKGVRCPMELSTYFRINAANTGQFERTLIIADEGAYVSYLEGCTAPMRDENQLHAAVVELITLDNAQIKYSTVQNWYPGDKDGKGGIFNFVTKRGACRGVNSKISWTQVETGSAKEIKQMDKIIEFKEWFIKNFNAFEESLNGENTPELHRVRKEALKNFNELSFPTVKDEEWRFTNISPLLKYNFTLPSEDLKISDELVNKFLFNEMESNILIFVNGKFSVDNSKHLLNYHQECLCNVRGCCKAEWHDQLKYVHQTVVYPQAETIR